MDTDERDPTEGDATPKAAPSEGTEETESDVAGHMHPILSEQMGLVRHQELLAEAERDRRGSQARSQGRDGGILEKMRRRTQR